MIRLATSSCDVTPSQPLPLAGYAARKGNFSKIGSRLEANLVLVGGEDDLLLLVSIDTLFSSEELERSLIDRLGVICGCDVSLWVVASHTHFAPSLDIALSGLGTVCGKYLGQVVDALVGEFENMLCGFSSGVERPVYGGHFSKVDLPFNISRRRIVWGIPANGVFPTRHCVVAPNPDDQVPSELELCVLQEDGVPCAVIWTWPCHTVNEPCRDAVSSDFVGVARVEIRDRLGRSNLPVLYLPGLAGDIRYRSSCRSFKMGHILRSGLAPRFRPNSEQLFEQLSDRVRSGIRSGLSSALESSPIALAEPRISRRTVDVSELVCDKVEQRFDISFLDLGALRVLGIGAEVCSGYRELACSLLPEGTWMTGYVGPVYGYLPTDADLLAGGYESEGFRRAFGLDHPYRDQIQDRVLEEIRLCVNGNGNLDS